MKTPIYSLLLYRTELLRRRLLFSDSIDRQTRRRDVKTDDKAWMQLLVFCDRACCNHEKTKALWLFCGLIAYVFSWRKDSWFAKLPAQMDEAVFEIVKFEFWQVFEIFTSKIKEEFNFETLRKKKKKPSSSISGIQKKKRKIWRYLC